MTYEITRGPIYRAQKVVIYGPEGIGKTTFAAQFPDVLFIDTESGSTTYDVARLPKPTSWTMFMDEIKEAARGKLCRSLAIDTIDWAERLCAQHVCASNQKAGIEDFGYGKGYVYVAEEFGKLLNLLSDVVESGINVVLTAHSMIYKFEQPDELGCYDRYTLKLGNNKNAKIADMVKEWADMLLFANYKTNVIFDSKTKKAKASGGERVMYTTHHAAWDAKNRQDLPEELPFTFQSIAGCFAGTPEPQASPVTTQKAEPVQVIKPEPKPAQKKQTEPAPAQIVDDRIPPELAALMVKEGVNEEDVRKAVAFKGYYPEDTPISSYDPEFISGCLVAGWEGVMQIIKENIEIPF